MSDSKPVVFGEAPLSVGALIQVAKSSARATLSTQESVRARLAAGAEMVRERLEQGLPTYGVNTGLGHASDRAISLENAEAMAHNLMRYHGCGTGRRLEPEEARAVVACRLASLARGYSGVRAEVLELMCELLNRDVLPCIPAEGSVGASGDLTPLSYVAATLMGEREVWHGGEVLGADVALRRVDLEPIVLKPKETLALMNGTSVMAGLLVLAFRDAQRLARLGASMTAMACEVMRGEPAHFDPRIFELKPHAGTVEAARWIRAGLVDASGEPARLQDRYSLRCAPHVLGVLFDALRDFRVWLETELNGVNDNPILLPDTGAVLHGGNFYGGHLAFIADGLKVAVANVAELMERQLIALCDRTCNAGLPESLLPGNPESSHGFKAMQIGASALTAEALKQCVPASVFSRSTENHNQDKVSMGTIAARECRRVIELTQTVASIHLLALAQAADVRGSCTSRATRALHRAVRAHSPMLHADRALDADIERVRSTLPEITDALPAPSDAASD